MVSVKTLFRYIIYLNASFLLLIKCYNLSSWKIAVPPSAESSILSCSKYNNFDKHLAFILYIFPNA